LPERRISLYIAFQAASAEESRTPRSFLLTWKVSDLEDPPTSFGSNSLDSTHAFSAADAKLPARRSQQTSRLIQRSSPGIWPTACYPLAHHSTTLVGRIQVWQFRKQHQALMQRW
jgi:hypothetical protein